MKLTINRNQKPLAAPPRLPNILLPNNYALAPVSDSLLPSTAIMLRLCGGPDATSKFIFHFLIFRSLIFRSLIFQFLIFRSLIFQFLIFRSLIFRFLIFRFLIFRSLIFRSLIFKSLIFVLKLIIKCKS